MATITIDNKEYALDSLSQQAKAELIMLQAAENEIRRLQQQLAIAQTARNAYAHALKAALASQETKRDTSPEFSEDEDTGTIKV